ncbi:hypothetical protein ES705_39631 [subsurface metagenome]
MGKEELLRLKGYCLLLAAADGDVTILTPEQRADLKQLLEKWMKENFD